jgi:hypothetical protein
VSRYGIVTEKTRFPFVGSSYAIQVASAPHVPSSVPTRLFPCSKLWPGTSVVGILRSLFCEARAHLGLCTQRQWTTRAIARTTPCLLGLFSLVVLVAHALHPEQLPTRHTAWYPKTEPTFVDALAAVRRHLWAQRNSPTPPAPLESVNSSEGLLDTLIDVAWYAA